MGEGGERVEGELREGRKIKIGGRKRGNREKLQKKEGRKIEEAG